MTLKAKSGLAVLAVALACHQAILTAPPNSRLTLIANPEFIPAHGGQSVITAVVIEPAGTPVPDGTVVQFFTTLGRIDEQGRTNDGVSRVILVSDSRSGTATVTAVSGAPGGISPSPSPSGSPIPTPTPSPSPTASPAPFPSEGRAMETLSDASAASNLSTMNSATVQVAIGSSLPSTVIVTAFPPRLTDKRASLITANVFDQRGNPVFNVPVLFAVDGPTESMDSQGSPTYTDRNGQAQDILRTRYDPGIASRTVKVKATTANGVSDDTTVTIN